MSGGRPRFLKTVGTSTVIRAVLVQAGYSDAEHAAGWALLHQVSGYRLAAAAPSTDPGIQNAIAELDAWNESNFRRIRAALVRLHPEQADYVFSGELVPAQGIAAVLSVETMLDRLDALAAGRSDATRTADQAALATLSGRGYTAQERTRLRQLVELAKRGTQVEAPQPPTDEHGEPLDRCGDLQALKLWYEDWVETARTMITRRDYLIRLGLAKRRVGGAAKPDEGGDEPGDAQDPTQAKGAG